MPSKRDRKRRRKGRKRRLRPGQLILRWAIVVVVLVLIVAGAGYGYFQYQFSKVASKPCSTCVAPASGAPYNVLIVGSDSRAGETAAEAQQFGSVTAAAGQRSDTIKIVHVDPATKTASSLSIPRDTYVTLSDMAAGSQLSSSNKINAAFANGPDALIATVQNTFGITISHYIVIGLFGLEDAVNALGGISLDFPYPVRDRDCSTGTCYNNSGLSIAGTGCQVLNGQEALALSRSRYFQYDKGGEWYSDPTSDLGRIVRQNIVIAAALNKAKSTYNPLKLNSLLASVVHDFSKDNGLSATALLSLAETYHAFSGSSLQASTIPTAGATSSVAGDVEVVQEPSAQQVITQFLGTTPAAVTTPPLDAYGRPIAVPTITTATAPATTGTTARPGKSTTTTTATTSSNPSYDPTPC